MRRLVALALVALVPSLAVAEPRRSTAVLEFRAGSTALPQLGSRIGAVLSSRTSLKVLGDDQARQRYGDGLDRAVVDCAGESACIGAIGRRLGTDEVMLVGVSELGDVILSIQRIESEAGVVSGRVAEALAADAAPTDDELVAYLERVLPAEDFVRFGTIAIKVNVAGAEIWVGGTSRGNSPIPAIRVPAPSSYPIEIKKAGFSPFRASVAVPPDGQVDVDAELQRPGRGGGAWYSRWWVGVAAGVIVAGGVTAAVLLTRDQSSVPISGHF